MFRAKRYQNIPYDANALAQAYTARPRASSSETRRQQSELEAKSLIGIK